MDSVLRALHGYGRPEGPAPPSSGSPGLARRVAALEDRFEKLLMVCQAQWALLQQETDLTEEQLNEKIREIDLSDGLLDGKVRVSVVECGQCGRKLGQRHPRCLYCGAPRDDDHAFRV
jgi:hypothetical protein